MPISYHEDLKAMQLSTHGLPDARSQRIVAIPSADQRHQHHHHGLSHQSCIHTPQYQNFQVLTIVNEHYVKNKVNLLRT